LTVNEDASSKNWVHGTRRHKIRNTVIREEIKIEEIKRNTEKIRFQWYGHVMHVLEDRIHKRMLRTIPRREETKAKTLNQMVGQSYRRHQYLVEMQVTET
jgi:hypothetical protein